MPVLRGTAVCISWREGYLWTTGYIPRLRTYPGFETPKPILVDINRGDGDLSTVMRDVLALTKINYNACDYSSGLPVTLKFADRVGEILTASPKGMNAPPWRRTRISASRAARTSNAERRASRIRLSKANIALCSNTLAALRHADDVLNRERITIVAGHNFESVAEGIYELAAPPGLPQRSQQRRFVLVLNSVPS
jgi:hypothetical protein